MVRGRGVSGLAVAVLGVAETANFGPVVTFLALFRPSPTHVGDVMRLTSSLEYATVAAMVLELLIPLMVACAVTTQSQRLRLTLLTGPPFTIAPLVSPLPPHPSSLSPFPPH